VRVAKAKHVMLQLAGMTRADRVGTLGTMGLPASSAPDPNSRDPGAGVPTSLGGNRRGRPQDRRRVIEVLTQLTAEERAVLWSAHHLGWSVEKIAGHYDLSKDTVKLRLHDAFQRLLTSV
jgi:DNA-directed RNA polymerase specialized sigma24 family protein